MEFGDNSGLNHNRETWQGCSWETMELLPVCSITTYLCSCVLTIKLQMSAGSCRIFQLYWSDSRR